MAKRRRGPVDFIRARPGTKMLYFRYQWPKDIGGSPREVSLKTADIQIARVRAAVYLIECANFVAERRAVQNAVAERRPETTLEYRFPPGDHELADGTTVQVVGGRCYYVAGGRVIRDEPNLVRRAVSGEGMTLAEYRHRIATDTLYEDEIGGIDCPGWRGEPVDLRSDVTEPKQCRAPVDGGVIVTLPGALKQTKHARPRPCSDDVHLDRWINHRQIDIRLAAEAREVWAKFREITDSKPLKDCDRDDGRKLVGYFFDIGNKSPTVRKKVGHLCAAVNLAIGEGKLRFNPFSSIIPRVEDAVKRRRMPESDMRLIRENRCAFDDQEWLLYMLCATTGMRREEAYNINDEEIHDGIRFVTIRNGKTKQSERRVPLPDAILPLVPSRIVKPLFSKNVKNLGREVLRQMERIGVKSPGLHTLRHRAKDRLREHKVDIHMQYEILGHEKMTVAAGYGHGSPTWMLKEWIELIGF